MLIATNQVTLNSSTPTVIVNPRPGRTVLRVLYSDGSATLFAGSDSVSGANGFRIFPGQVFELLQYDGHLYGITAPSGTSICEVLEIYPLPLP